MIKVENIDVWGFEHAVRGMRNPLNSWDKSDSEVAFHAFENFNESDPLAEKYKEWNDKYNLNIKIGKNDLDLMRRLYNAGTEHRKYLRQVFVSMDITGPLYWWKEMDQYRINVTTNSCSTMHKIADKEFKLSDFSTEHMSGSTLAVFNKILEELNYWRKCYLHQKNKVCWWQMIQLLPASYNQKRTITMNYENVVTMIKQRSGHKLDEWNKFIDVLIDLPYIKEILDVKE